MHEIDNRMYVTGQSPEYTNRSYNDDHSSDRIDPPVNLTMDIHLNFEAPAASIQAIVGTPICGPVVDDN